MPLTPEEQKQYNRHLILDEIGIEGQKKLKAAKVLVIGAGGLGCPVLQYLAAAGVGEIGIIDNDTVDQSNLQRQVLFTHDDIGKYKAEVAAERLQKLNPFIEFKVFKDRLSTENAISLFNQFEIIVDGSDNFPTRYLVNDAAVIANKPVVFGSIFKFDGQVSVFNYKKGPTYRCLFPNPPKEGEVPNCSDIGVLGVLPGIVGSLQANEVIKMICGVGEVLSGHLLTFDALSLQQHRLKFFKNEAIQITSLLEDYNFFCGVNQMPEEITLEALQMNPEKYNLLDVRTYPEREQYNIGGMHIPLDELESRFKEISTDKNLVVYCKAGYRSEAAINYLKTMGFESSLINLKNGLFG